MCRATVVLFCALEMYEMYGMEVAGRGKDFI